MMALFNEETIQKAYGQEKFDEGRDEGAEMMAGLAALLAKEGKTDAIIRAGTDVEYRNDLLKEYRLA